MKLSDFFGGFKDFSRVCARYEKLDVMYSALNLALIFDELKLC